MAPSSEGAFCPPHTPPLRCQAEDSLSPVYLSHVSPPLSPAARQHPPQRLVSRGEAREPWSPSSQNPRKPAPDFTPRNVPNALKTLQTQITRTSEKMEDARCWQWGRGQGLLKQDANPRSRKGKPEDPWGWKGSPADP